MPDFERIRIGGGADLAPCVVGIGRHDRAGAVGDGDDIALQVLDIGVKAARGPVVIIDIAGRSVLIIADIQALPVPSLLHEFNQDGIFLSILIFSFIRLTNCKNVTVYFNASLLYLNFLICSIKTATKIVISLVINIQHKKIPA